MTWGSAVGGTMQAAASAYGAYLSSKSAKKQRKEQRKFAQQQIRWRVADAKAAGIHPLAALGYTGLSYQPVDDRTGQYLSQMGQGLGRAAAGAIDAVSNRKMRDQEIESRELDLEYKHLRNDAQLMENMGQQTAGPNVHGALNRRGVVPGQSVDVQPDQVIATRPGAPGMAAGIHPAEMFTEVPTSKHGTGLIPTLTQELTESMEDNLMFKMPYYGMKLEEYFQALKANWKGSKSEFHRRWIGFWQRYLPQPRKGYRWEFSNFGYFYQTRKPRKDPIGERATRRLFDYYRPDPVTGPYIGP